MYIETATSDEETKRRNLQIGCINQSMLCLSPDHSVSVDKNTNGRIG